MSYDRYGLCAICTREGHGEVRAHDGKRVFICDPCEFEHPRSGRYSFDERRNHESTGAYKQGTSPGGRHGNFGNVPVRGSRRG